MDLWTWRFGGSGTEGPRAEERRKHPGVAAATPLECWLSPGDVVYIPAGWWHTAEALDSGLSLHIGMH